MNSTKKDIALVLLGATLGFGGAATVASIDSSPKAQPATVVEVPDGGPPYLWPDGVFRIDPPEAK